MLNDINIVRRIKMTNNKSGIPKLRFPGYTEPWEQRKLGDVVEMFNGDRGRNYPKNSELVAEGIPFINAGDLQDGQVNLENCKRISREKFNQLSGAKIKRGDILYCLRGTIGKNALVNNFDEGTVASSLVDIRPKNIDEMYLFIILNSDIEYRQRVLTDEGAAQPNLSVKNISKFNIPTPEIEEHYQIAKFFKSINSLITLHQRKLDDLKTQKKGLLQKMFPKNGEDVPEVRFPGFTGAWEQRKLGEIATRIRGNDGRMNLPTLTISAGSGWMDQKDRFSKNIAGKEQQNYTLLKKGELSYNHGNSKLAQYGAVFELENYAEALVPRVYHSFSVSSQSDPKFIEQMFATHRPDRELRKLVSSGARMDGLLNINYDAFMSIKVWLPSIKEQRTIARMLMKINNTITLHQRKIEHLQLQKKGLLQQMFV